jgi:hypothetical protein
MQSQEGHKKDIHFIVFSNNGSAVVTGAKDGTLRVSVSLFLCVCVYVCVCACVHV